MKISVVIGTYNQKENLKMVLESFFSQTLSPNDYEIIVVDSFSSDGTDAMIEHLKPTCRLNYIRQENKGKSAARNRGADEARAEIILFVDADMLADPDLLYQHLQIHENKKNVCIEGLTFNLVRQLLPEDLSPNHPQVKPYIKQKLRPFQKLKWSYFLTGNLSIRKKAFEKAGKFDENFLAYGWEDIELGYRLKNMKIPLIYNPYAVNYHYHFVSDQDMLKRKFNMGKSAAYFYQKHPNFEIKMFLGMNPAAMFIFHVLKKHPKLLGKIKNQHILEEYNYRLGLTEGLKET